jgi:hypothetical protein
MTTRLLPVVLLCSVLPGGNLPFNRNTGVCLLLDMKYLNFNEVSEDATGIGLGEYDEKAVCIITVSRQGTWCSLGSENIDFTQTQTFTQQTANVYTQEGVFLDRYRQGIKIISRTHGSIGQFDMFSIVNAIIQGLVLQHVATNGIPGMTKLTTFAQIFGRFAAAPVDDHIVTTKTAAQAAVKCSQFFRAFDPSMSGSMDETRMFDMLKVLLAADLSEEQIAEVVKDMRDCADYDGDGVCNVDEFIQFLTDDE